MGAPQRQAVESYLESISLPKNSSRPSAKVRKIAIIGTHLPQQCGIATFTAHLTQALGSDPDLSVDVIAINDGRQFDYPEVVKWVVQKDELASYRASAKFLNDGAYDVVCVQHEYGIFGGECGDYLMTLLRDLKMPAVTVMHTVMRTPNEVQRRITGELLQLSDRVIVMCKASVGYLKAIYGAHEDKVEYLPHGIPDFHLKQKPNLPELAGTDKIILTFGLLSPDKGIQYAIGALPKIAERYPNALYVVLGATHPNIKAEGGECYREGLMQAAEDLGVGANLKFINRFVSDEELADYILAADIYVTPYLNPQQATSGTLSYAIGAGKPVISTPYWHAQELLAEERGILVDFKDSIAIADAVLELWDNAEYKAAIEDRARSYSDGSQWSKQGAVYHRIFSEAVSSNAASLITLAVQGERLVRKEGDDLNLDHLISMCDETGLLQHATFAIPNRREGYCVDDNARALILTTMLEADNELTPEVRAIQQTTLAFLLDAYNPSNGRFRNFMSYDRTWLEDRGSEDSHGRSLWAASSVMKDCRTNGYRKVARDLFNHGIGAVKRMTSPRAWAYAILACVNVLEVDPSHGCRFALNALAQSLMGQFQGCSSPEWEWFEDTLAYANPRLPHALLVAGDFLNNHHMKEVGTESLAWLNSMQLDGAIFSPIGSHGFASRDGQRATFDQQPIEAWCSISANVTAAKILGQSEPWLTAATAAYNWFHGRNCHGVKMYDSVTGACYDGLTEHGHNENCGAESTLSYLCAGREYARASAKERVGNSL